MRAAPLLLKRSSSHLGLVILVASSMLHHAQPSLHSCLHSIAWRRLPRRPLLVAFTS